MRKLMAKTNRDHISEMIQISKYQASEQVNRNESRYPGNLRWLTAKMSKS